MCDLGKIENESHFSLYCPCYESLKKSMFDIMYEQVSRIFWSTDKEKMEWLFNFVVFKLAKFVFNAWKTRQ